jgi:hypothetical protein
VPAASVQLGESGYRPQVEPELGGQRRRHAFLELRSRELTFRFGYPNTAWMTAAYGNGRMLQIPYVCLARGELGRIVTAACKL